LDRVGLLPPQELSRGEEPASFRPVVVQWQERGWILGWDIITPGEPLPPRHAGCQRHPRGQQQRQPAGPCTHNPPLLLHEGPPPRPPGPRPRGLRIKPSRKRVARYGGSLRCLSQLTEGAAYNRPSGRVKGISES